MPIESWLSHAQSATTTSRTTPEPHVPSRAIRFSEELGFVSQYRIGAIRFSYVIFLDSFGGIVRLKPTEALSLTGRPLHYQYDCQLCSHLISQSGSATAFLADAVTVVDASGRAVDLRILQRDGARKMRKGGLVEHLLQSWALSGTLEILRIDRVACQIVERFVNCEPHREEFSYRQL